MKSRIPQVQIAFVALLAISGIGIVGYQAYFIWPVDKCENHGDWWDPKDRVCAVPMPISQFTGRRVDGKLVIERRVQAAAAPASAAKP